jgi:hypothetical protein
MFILFITLHPLFRNNFQQNNTHTKVVQDNHCLLCTWEYNTLHCYRRYPRSIHNQAQTYLYNRCPLYIAESNNMDPLDVQAQIHLNFHNIHYRISIHLNTFLVVHSLGQNMYSMYTTHILVLASSYQTFCLS